MRRDPMPTIRLLGALALVAAGASGCVAPGASPAPRPAPEAVPARVPDDLAAPWTARATPGTVRQEIRLESSLASRVDTVERRDTIRTVVAAEWSRLAGDAPARLSGLLTDFRVSADTTEPLVPSGLALPFAFTATEGIGGVQAHFARPETSGCGTDAAAVHVLREVLVWLPRRLEPGTAWADSARYTICRDSIPLSVRSVRAFRVTGAERRGVDRVVLLERRSTVTMQGEGRQFGEPIAVEAEGESVVQLVVRLEGAFVVGGSGESELRMTMRGRRRSQELTQHTRIEILAP